MPAVRKPLKNYARMKLLMEKWIDLAMELSILRLTKNPTEYWAELRTVQFCSFLRLPSRCPLVDSIADHCPAQPSARAH